LSNSPRNIGQPTLNANDHHRVHQDRTRKSNATYRALDNQGIAGDNSLDSESGDYGMDPGICRRPMWSSANRAAALVWLTMKLAVHQTSLPDVLVVEHEVFEDDRGFFMEVYRADQFAAHAGLGLPSTFVQLNHSRSAHRVTRGLHFQWDPPMGKLMRVARGEAFLVAVDIRPDSPTLGRYESIIASEGNHLQLWAPAGFARGFATLSEVADVQYLTTGIYNPAAESGVRWDDPKIGIDWPVLEPILSRSDAEAQSLTKWLERPEAQAFNIGGHGP
jgi:dTDP-4-dehydrorhamnose 3,5-epimerase